MEALNSELHHLERISATLKNLSAANTTVRSAELNHIEESLLHFVSTSFFAEILKTFLTYFSPFFCSQENRFQEELEIALEVYNYNATGKSADEMINYGTALIKMAKDELAKHPNHAHREVVAVNLRIAAIERLIADLARHETGRRHDIDEAVLVQTELSLRTLLQRLQHEDK